MKNDSNKKLYKILMIVGIILLIIWLLFVGLKYYAKDKIEKKVAEWAEHKYQVRMGDITLKLFQRTVSFHDVEIRRIDHENYNYEEDNFIRRVYLSLGELKIKGIRLKNSDTGNISFKGIEMISPVVNLEFEGKTTVSDRYPERDFAGIITDFVIRTRLSHFLLTNGKIRYREICGDDDVVYNLKNINISTDEIIVDTSYRKNIFYSNDIDISVGEFSYQFPDKSMDLRTDSIKMNVKNQNLTIDNIRLIPRYPKEEYAQKVKGHPDWMEFTIKRTVFSGADFRNLAQNNYLRIDSLYLGNINVASYKNRKIKRAEKVKPLFYETVQRFPVPLQIRTILVDRLDVEYDELAENGVRPGKISFTNVTGLFTNVTNVPNRENPHITLSATGKLMNEGEVRTECLFPVDSLTDNFRIKGILNKMSLVSLNPILSPLANVEVKTGYLSKLEFDMSGGRHHARVDMKMLYSDLKVALLRENNRKRKERVFLSNIVNEFMLNESNPDQKGTRAAHGEYDRNYYRSQYNYFWKTLFPGVKETIGL